MTYRLLPIIRFLLLVSAAIRTEADNIRPKAAFRSPPPAFVWAVSAEGSGIDVGRTSAVDNDGNLFLCGSFTDRVRFGNHTLTGQGSADIFLAKCDPSGAWQWAKQAGGFNYDLGSGVATDTRGNVLLIGSIQGRASFDTGVV